MRGLLAWMSVVVVVGCDRGPGRSARFDAHGSLASVEFPDPLDVNTEPTTRPTLPIVDDEGDSVSGSYSVQGRVVTFTPTLPLREPRARDDGTWTPDEENLADSGLVDLDDSSGDGLDLGVHVTLERKNARDLDSSFLRVVADVEGEEPRLDVVADGTSIQVTFQGASAVAEGSKEVDPATQTAWSISPAIADGMQFLRVRITFDVSAGVPVGVERPRPGVDRLEVSADYRSI